MYVSLPRGPAAVWNNILVSLLSAMMSTVRWHQEAAPRNDSGSARQYGVMVWLTRQENSSAQHNMKQRATASILADGVLQVVKSASCTVCS
jgi:hypothetical protein